MPDHHSTATTVRMPLWRSAVACVLGIAACGGMYVIDLQFGRDLGLSIFYLAIVVAVSLAGGIRSGIVVSAAAASAWVAGDIQDFPERSIGNAVWLGIVRLATFAFAAIVIGRLKALRQTTDGLNRRLTELLKRESDLARTDALTGLFNARAFNEALQTGLARSRRDTSPLCVLYLDLDNFKRVNDRFGHSAGDDLLKAIGNMINQSLREGDVAARLGGDEFAALLWNTDTEEAAKVAGRLIEQVKALGASYESTGVGASAGIAMLDDSSLSPGELVRRADETMYRAKAAGKGSVVVWRQSAEAAA